MAIEDNTVYGLTGAQVKELPGKIEAVKGQAKILTTADYNWPTNNPDGVAVWAKDPGFYEWGANVKVYYAPGYSVTASSNAFVLKSTQVTTYGATRVVLIPHRQSHGAGISDTYFRLSYVAPGSGGLLDPRLYDVADIITSKTTVNNLTSTSAIFPLSANQGRVLKGLIDAIVVPTKTSDLTNDSDYQTGSQVSTAIGTETTARQNADVNLQGQIDAIVASSDVKDIVGTKAELNAYDTSTLGDKDIVKVLQDESEDNATTYYRWSTATSTFTLIGEEGPYYTKAEADTLLNAKANASTTYTKSEVDTALSGKVDNSTLNDYATTTAMNTALASKANTADVYTKTQVDTALDGKADASTTYTKTEIDTALAGKADASTTYTKTQVDTALSAKANTADLATVATTNSYNDLDNLPTLPAVVQTTGTSQTDVMSQNAVTSMVYKDPASKGTILMGTNAHANSSASNAVAIGARADAGYVAGGNDAVAVGKSAYTAGNGAVALGAYAGASGAGIASIGLERATAAVQTTHGYNGSAYRLLTGLYDPQSIHDAATKGYVDTSITTAISGIVGVEFEVVQTLPATGDAGTIYLVPNQGTTPNIYDEYIYVNNAFEKIGTTEIDLSNYVTTTDLNTALANYTTTANLATVATSGDYNDLINTPTTFTTNEWNALWA